MSLHKDFTTQEELTAEILTEFGIRYLQQYNVPNTNYIADFYIAEIEAILECDGPNGHLRKADEKRTQTILDVAGDEIKWVLRVNATSKKGIREQLWQELQKLETTSQNEK